MEHFVRTYTGRNVSLTAPKPSDIDIRDIAKHLSQINRFNGATRLPVSVAQHSLIVVKLMAEQGADTTLQLHGLLHDAHEAYIGDIVGPVRAVLASRVKSDICSEIAAPLDRAILAAFELALPTQSESRAIERADRMALNSEWRDLMEGANWLPGQAARFEIRPMKPDKAEEKYLEVFQTLAWARTNCAKNSAGDLFEAKS